MEAMDLEPINELDTPMKEDSNYGLVKTSSVNVLPASRGMKLDQRGKKVRHSSVLIGA